MMKRLFLLTAVACALGGGHPVGAVPVTWQDSQWTVEFPAVAISGDKGDTNHRRAFGRTIQNEETVDLTGGDAWLRASAHADDDAYEGVSISATVNATRSFSLSGAPYGWGVTVNSNLRGQLWNDDLPDPLWRGTTSGVSGSATVIRNNVALGGTTHSATNSTHEQTLPIDESKKQVIELSDGSYQLKASLTTSAEIGLGCGLPGTCAEANSLFFASPSEALGGLVTDATRWGLHVNDLKAEKLGHVTIDQALISPQTTAAPRFAPLNMSLFLDLTNDGGSSVTVNRLDFSLFEFDELSPSDTLKTFSVPELLSLSPGQSKQLAYSFVMSAQEINKGIDDFQSDRNHLDFGVDGTLFFADFASTRSVTFFVPEPSSALLILIGLTGIHLVNRRQRRPLLRTSERDPES